MTMMMTMKNLKTIEIMIGLELHKGRKVPSEGKIQYKRRLHLLQILSDYHSSTHYRQSLKFSQKLRIHLQTPKSVVQRLETDKMLHSNHLMKLVMTVKIL